jgi:2-amino-4-hydroxy-6-hydroxymethyldihydropteridine diphosphokinase
MNRAYLCLGSNIDSERNLPRAVWRLRTAGRLLAVSRVYETAPVGRTDQPPFLNAAVLLETACLRVELKEQVITGIETELGRRRDPTDKNAPRTIDIDIAIWCGESRAGCGQRRAGAEPLACDPEILRHAHVAVPLAELAPDLVHPDSGEALSVIAARLTAGQPPLRVRPDVRLDG